MYCEAYPIILLSRNIVNSIHKMSVTGGKVEIRIANAAHDATYLLADVEVVASI